MPFSSPTLLGPRSSPLGGVLYVDLFLADVLLDDGAQEVLVMPTAEDGKLLRDLINDADALYWDTQNEVLIFGTVK